jgi:hypothetical protein
MTPHPLALPKGERIRGFFHFWDQRPFQEFLHLIENVSGFLSPEFSCTIESDPQKLSVRRSF